MIKVWLGAAGLAAIGWLFTPVYAQEPCAGDCDGSGSVAINELVRCVSIALGNADVSTCDACDVNGDGEVKVNELVAAVNAALTQCGGGGMARCGNGSVETGEECDDGNNFGGDECSANCTDESGRTGVFDPAQTISSVQSFGLLVGPLHLTGSQVLRVGKPRDTDTLGPDGSVIFKAQEVPVVIKAEELVIEPISVLGALCACVRGVPAPELFGDGVSGSGRVSCNEEGLTDIDYRVIQDHNTSPGDPDNLVEATPDDAECDDVSILPGGTTSSACVEGVGATCDDAELFNHIGVCNGPRVLTRSGGPAGRGSAFILNNSAIGLLSGGPCDSTPLDMRPGRRCPDGSRPPEPDLSDYGPDCLPCTADDMELGNANNLPTTTGTAEAAVFDANNEGDTIDEGLACNNRGDICVTSVTGRPVNCDAVISGEGALGGALAVAFPALHAETIRDNVTTTLFVNKEE
jgi:cysteine-rich repeat protein